MNPKRRAEVETRMAQTDAAMAEVRTLFAQYQGSTVTPATDQAEEEFPSPADPRAGFTYTDPTGHPTRVDPNALAAQYASEHGGNLPTYEQLDQLVHEAVQRVRQTQPDQWKPSVDPDGPQTDSPPSVKAALNTAVRSALAQDRINVQRAKEDPVRGALALHRYELTEDQRRAEDAELAALKAKHAADKDNPATTRWYDTLGNPTAPPMDMHRVRAELDHIDGQIKDLRATFHDKLDRILDRLDQQFPLS